jgi:MinD superfamily P-loop ATPase
MKAHQIGEFNHLEKENLIFIESKLALTEEQAVPLINQGNKLLREDYSKQAIQILDCPPGTSCPMVAATKDANLVILVTEPTAFGLNDLQLAVETMRLMKKEFMVIINRDGSGDDRVDDYCQKESIPIIGRIAFDKAIAHYYAQGKLVYDKLPEVKKEIDFVVKQIQEKIAQHA